MKFIKIKPAAIILIIGWLLGCFTIPVIAETGDFQTTGNLVIYDMAIEGENIYLAGSASNYSGQLQAGSLNLSGGLKDIYLAKYDLDGNLLFEALIGGENDDSAFGLVVQQGVMYVLGETWSQQFPGAPGNAGEDDALVLSVAADGSQVQWARRIGGSDQDSGRAIALQGSSLYLTGISWSSDLVAGAAKGNADAFLARLDLSGGLEWLKVFGGSNLDVPYDLVLSPEKIWVTGQTFSNNFGGTVRGGGDIFAVRFDQSGNNEFSGLYGSRQEEIGFSIDLADDGSIYISGATKSADLPSAIGEYSNEFDGLLIKLNNAGDLQFSTYMGGTGIDYGYDSSLLPNGDIMVSGMTGSPLFPLGFSDELASLGGSDAFVVQVNSSGQMVDVWQVGGSQDDRATEILVTSNGVWLSGQFSDQANPYLYKLSPDNLGNVILPTSQPTLPTATLAVTATSLPTETPNPTFTYTPLPGKEFPSLTITEMNTSTPTVPTVFPTENESTMASATIEVSENEDKLHETEPIEIQVEADNLEEKSSTSIFIYFGITIIVLMIGFVFWRRFKRS